MNLPRLSGFRSRRTLALLGWRRFLVVSIVVLAVAFSWRGASAPAPARAQSGGAYEVSWSTTASGGGAASGGAYALKVTVGEPAIGTASGGNYSLGGGFWGAATTALQKLFLPSIRR